MAARALRPGTLIRSAASAALELLYPPRCVGCGAFGQLVCDACRAGMARVGAKPICPHCSSRWEGEGNCDRCYHLHPLEHVTSAVEMQGAARRMVHALKYAGVRALAPVIAREIATAAAGLRFDAVYAVPLHRSRQRSRGFNQSELLALAAGFPRPEGRLRRERATKTQVGQRLGERRSNVAGAFAYEGPRLDGLTVAVLDDVITTGATVLECALVLKEAGARRVHALSFARATWDPARDARIHD